MSDAAPAPIEEGKPPVCDYPLLDHFAVELAGKTLLDIHGDDLHLSRAALQRGAKRAVALLPLGESLTPPERSTDAHRQPEVIAAEFESWSSADRFDVVHCRTLHQMYDPIHALRRMVELARESILLELVNPAADGRWGRYLGIDALLRRKPAIWLSDPHLSVNTADRPFLISPKALRIFFNKHYACFTPIRIFPLRAEGRTLVRADFRKIGTLTVVAGATSSGKSTFLRRLREDPELRSRLDLPEISARTSARTLHEQPAHALDHVLFHYDLLRPFGRPMRSYERDPALSLLRSARRVNVLTIMTPHDRLLRQFEQATEAEHGGSRWPSRKLELLRRYQDPEFLHRWHRAWLDFCEMSSVNRHIIVENDGGYRFRPAGHQRDGTSDV